MPLADKAAGWGGSGERVRDGPHDRPRREHAPCNPQAGGLPGEQTQGRKGEDGSHTASPPPPLQRDKCLASCLHRAGDVLTPEHRQRGRPPPTHFSPTNPGKGRGQQADSEGLWGGAEDRPKRRGKRRAASGGDARQPEPKKKKEQQSKTTRQSRDRKQGRRGYGRNQGARKGVRERGIPRGRQRRGKSLADKSPQESW